MFDPFWARVNEAGITVVVHAGDSGYSSQRLRERTASRATFERRRDAEPSIKMLHDRAGDLRLPRVARRSTSCFERFPNLRIASVENGAEFLPDLFRSSRSMRRKIPGYFPEDPVEIFRAHVWINPFWEDDVYEIVELMGADRVIFGSDWPHIEGMPEPARLRRASSRSSTPRRSA